MSRTQLELHIDFTRCEGRGLCAELLPELLRRDEWGYPVGRGGRDIPVPARLAEAGQDAVDLCPVQALRLRRVSRT
jgi:ferredoxin